MFLFLCPLSHLRAQTADTVILCKFMVWGVLYHVFTLDVCDTAGLICPFNFNDVLCRYSPSISKISEERRGRTRLNSSDILHTHICHGCLHAMYEIVIQQLDITIVILPS